MDFGFTGFGSSSDISDGRTFYFATKDTALADLNYRYRYLEPDIEVIGKKGNRMTYLKNSEYFAEKLRVPSEYFSKYIAGRLSCPSSFDSVRNCQTFKGEYTIEQVKNYLFEFIKNYSLCIGCDYPETVLAKNEKKILIKHCESCGTDSIINCKSTDKSYDFIDKKIK
jgi:translation initiation factor 2 beta subunit (eIF-2beta)/eIF-5